jgi:hypothetical protein
MEEETRPQLARCSPAILRVLTVRPYFWRRTVTYQPYPLPIPTSLVPLAEQRLKTAESKAAWRVKGMEMSQLGAMKLAREACWLLGSELARSHVLE